MEMQGALKGYLESGEYRIGDYHGVGDSGMILLGNISADKMDVNADMTAHLPAVFHESALLDRFHGCITGWDIPKMRESLKASGWALNTEYFVEILHALREETIYRSVVDRLLDFPPQSATRDTEAIKRLCTAWLKLLFPNATDVDKVNLDDFREYCLEPAVAMRRVIKRQLEIVDPGEFAGKKVPDVMIRVTETDEPITPLEEAEYE
jgi:ATP-dependent Lon protease